MLMYDGWLIISLSAWGKMTGCQSFAWLLFPFGHQQPNLSTWFHTHFFSFLFCRVTFQVTKVVTLLTIKSFIASRIFLFCFLGVNDFGFRLMLQATCSALQIKGRVSQ